MIFTNNEDKEDKIIGLVQETYNYDKFKKQLGNREIYDQALKTIDRSTKEFGWKPEPIFVNEKYEVCEGQHRLTYAKEHNLPIPYIVRKGLTADDCIRINARRKNWTRKDYIDHYAELGNPSYKKIKELKEKYDLEYSIILYALTGSSTEGVSGNTTKGLLMGKLVFEENQVVEAQRKLAFIHSLLPEINAIKGRKNTLCWALMIAYECKDIDNNRLKKVIKEGYKRTNPPIDLINSLLLIEDLYNYHIGKKVWLVKYYEENVKNKKKK